MDLKSTRFQIRNKVLNEVDRQVFEEQVYVGPLWVRATDGVEARVRELAAAELAPEWARDLFRRRPDQSIALQGVLSLRGP